MKTLMDHIQEFARETQLRALQDDIMDDNSIDDDIRKLEQDIFYDVGRLIKSIVQDNIWSPT